MIDKDDLKEITKFTNHNLGQDEKSFFQDLILFIIYNNYASEVVFKGGTALSKCYGFDRFSEDLDFTLTKELPKIRERIEQGLKHYNVIYEIHSEQNQNSSNYKLLIRGPLYISGNRNSLCSIRIELSLREKVLLPPNTIKIKPVINLIPMFDLIVMNKKEIFAEKIRALFTRKQARDLYDLYYLDDSVASIAIINEKLKIYNIKFTKKGYLNNINKNKVIWDTEMKHLVKSYPDFKSVKKKLLGYFNQTF